LFGIGFQFRHQVVVDFCFNFQCPGNIHMGSVGFQVGKLAGGDQPVICLHAGKRQPDLPPDPALVLFAPQGTHLGTAVSPAKRGKVTIKIRGHFRLRAGNLH